MAFNPEIQYKVIPSRHLKSGQKESIRDLIAQSIAVDYPQRSEQERAYFVAQNVVGNPNRGVGGSLLRTQQAYANSLSVLAIRDDELISHLPVADNASSRKTGLAGAAEIQAKLHMPVAEFRGKEFIKKRYVWLGYAALTPELHVSAAENTDEVNPLDIMIALATDMRDRRQPVTSYPWDEERAWRTELASIGLVNQLGQDEPVHAFGPDAKPVRQERWKAESIADVEALIFAKDGAVRALERLNHSLASQGWAS